MQTKYLIMPATLNKIELAFLSATEIAKLIKDRVVTSQEVTEFYLKRIEQYNPKINAIVISLKTDAIERAIAADKALNAGEDWGVLHGVPITVKESFNIKGYKTTVNFKQIKNHVASEDSDVVKKLYDAGAIILGKTNVPTLLSDHQTIGDIYPRGNNPFDINRTVGGSTGGGAAAVAAGLSSLSIGSDIGGSVRIPAHFCGLFSLKTTEKAISKVGHVPPLPKAKGAFDMMSVLGPLARSIDDLELAFELLKEPNIEDEQSQNRNWPKAQKRDIDSYKLAWTTSINKVQAGKETTQLIENLVQKLSQAGVKMEQSLPKIDYQKAEENWGNIFGKVMGQDLPWLIQKIVKLQQAYSYGTRSKGKYIAKGIGVKDQQLTEYLALRQSNIDTFHDFFKAHDFILCPMGVGPAFEHCKKGDSIVVDGKKVDYWDMCLTYAFVANVLGIPALMVPLGTSAEGLPIGLQILGPYCSERDLLHFGRQLMPFIQGFKAPKGFE